MRCETVGEKTSARWHHLSKVCQVCDTNEFTCRWTNINIHSQFRNEVVNMHAPACLNEWACSHFHLHCLWCVCVWRFAAHCDHFRSPPATSRVPLHQGHNGAIRRLIMAVWSTGRPTRRPSWTASLMAHYSLLNDHTDDPDSVAGCPRSACLKQHFTPPAFSCLHTGGVKCWILYGGFGLGFHYPVRKLKH